MSSTQVLQAPASVEIAPELDHYYCEDCYPPDEEFGLCGTDLRGMGPWQSTNPKCTVCMELQFCPLCGDELEK